MQTATRLGAQAFVTRYLPGFLLLATMFLLSIGWVAVLAVDVFNVAGSQSYVMRESLVYPLLWYHLFSEGSPVEILQWALLAASFGLAVNGFVTASRAGHIGARRLWFLLGAGLLLMLAEDSLNVRHIIASAYLLPALEPALDERTVRLAWELSFYAAIATLMAIPFAMLFFGALGPVRPPRRLLIAYGVYGLVAFGSAMRRVGDWQERLGHWLIEVLALRELPAWSNAFGRAERAMETHPDRAHSVGYMLVDHLVEESVELVAASLLLSGLLVVWFRLRAVHQKPDRQLQ